MKSEKGNTAVLTLYAMLLMGIDYVNFPVPLDTVSALPCITMMHNVYLS